MVIRTTNEGERYEVDEVGSQYINKLHLKLLLAEDLARQVDQLNPKCNEIGAGYMANMKIIATEILKD